MILILMGVTGSGKSTVGTLLATRLGATFSDADDFHPAANRAKMAAGHPLNDDDRAGWLEILNHVLLGWYQAGTTGIMACSALKQIYRATLQHGLPHGAVSFCMLDGSQELLEERLAARHHEFMNPALLGSQLSTLEKPSPADAIRVTNDGTPAETVEHILEQLRARSIVSPEPSKPTNE